MGVSPRRATPAKTSKSIKEKRSDTRDKAAGTTSSMDDLTKKKR